MARRRRVVVEAPDAEAAFRWHWASRWRLIADLELAPSTRPRWSVEAQELWRELEGPPLFSLPGAPAWKLAVYVERLEELGRVYGLDLADQFRAYLDNVVAPLWASPFANPNPTSRRS
jgi:hypothetical protein